MTFDALQPGDGSVRGQHDVRSQVVDAVKGVHCVIRKRDFPAW